MIKYIKSVLWRVAKRLSYTEEARCLKVNSRINAPLSGVIVNFRLYLQIYCRANTAEVSRVVEASASNNNYRQALYIRYRITKTVEVKKIIGWVQSLRWANTFSAQLAQTRCFRAYSAIWNSRSAASLADFVRKTLIQTKHKYIYKALNFRPKQALISFCLEGQQSNFSFP